MSLHNAFRNYGLVSGAKFPVLQLLSITVFVLINIYQDERRNGCMHLCNTMFIAALTL
jgi:hypothetical protein